MSIELIVFDVDGTLTNGAIIYDSEGVESKQFCVKDGLAIASWIRLGKEAVIMTGRSSKVVQRRADELGMSHCYQGVKDKAALIEQIAKERGIAVDSIAAMGDDLNDYKMLKMVGISATPSNGAKEIQSIVDCRLEAKGGEGAAREFVEYLIEKEGLKERYLELWV